MHMASYDAGLKGYIADVPQFYFKRADGTVFVNKHVTQCSLNPQTDFQEIRAGWSNYASAYIPGQSTMDVQITMGNFDADLFRVANAIDKYVTDPTFRAPMSESLVPDATSHKITLTNTPVAGTVFINGMTEATGSTPAAGTFVVDAEAKTVEFVAADVPANMGSIEVYYDTLVEDASVINIDNQSVACGETILKWPVYSDGKDCTDSKIIKYIVVRIFRTRVTTAPGFDTSLTNWTPCGVTHLTKRLLNGEHLMQMKAAA